MPRTRSQLLSRSLLYVGHRLRRIVERATVALIVLLLVASWQIERCEVPSGSMATALLGRHRRLSCRDCGHEFVCGADEPAMRGKRAICPNCGYAGQELESAPVVRGDRVLLDRSAFEWRPPRRWELAAFRNPAAASQIFVKRIAGLPHETIEIRHGDVYADGDIQRKTLTEQRAIAVLVYDGNSSPAVSASLPQRWQAEPRTTRWQAAGGRFWRPPAGRASQAAGGLHEIDWLTYRHWRRRPGMPGEAEESPITDQCGYNQTQAIVNSHPVRDLFVCCRLRISGQGRLAWFITDGQTQFLLELSPAERQAELRREGALVATTAELPQLADRETQFELSLCDRQVLLALDGRIVLKFPYTEGSAPFHPTSRPIAVGTQDLGVELRDLKLFRDVYYTPPASGPANLPGTQVVQYRLGADEYLMLGDNSPVSADSRSWFEEPAVTRELLAGKPFVVYFPSRFWSWRGLGFQVPDPSRIRYIH